MSDLFRDENQDYRSGWARGYKQGQVDALREAADDFDGIDHFDDWLLARADALDPKEGP